MGTVGGAGRRDFTVLGDTVNVAFRLEGIAGKLGTKFILSEASAKLIDDKFPLASLGNVEVEGRTGEVAVYSPANLDSIISNHSAGSVSEQEIDSHARRYLELSIVSGILKRLESELDEDLHFHSPSHSRDVVREALGFAVSEEKNSRDLELIAIAAAFHDAGFLERRIDNEPIGGEMAAEAMRKSGNYSEEDIALVRQMILDTKVDPESPVSFQQSNTRLSPYLLDADVSNFGREDFFERLEASRKEQGMGEPKEIYSRTLAFMESHDWQTEAARIKRDDKKQDNMRRLRELTLSQGN
jgi:predicted metal-dependent HD superfamily phosphohydrolase